MKDCIFDEIKEKCEHRHIHYSPDGEGKIIYICESGRNDWDGLCSCEACPLIDCTKCFDEMNAKTIEMDTLEDMVAFREARDLIIFEGDGNKRDIALMVDELVESIELSKRNLSLVIEIKKMNELQNTMIKSSELGWKQLKAENEALKITIKNMESTDKVRLKEIERLKAGIRNIIKAVEDYISKIRMNPIWNIEKTIKCIPIGLKSLLEDKE